MVKKDLLSGLGIPAAAFSYLAKLQPVLNALRESHKSKMYRHAKDYSESKKRKVTATATKSNAMSGKKSNPKKKRKAKSACSLKTLCNEVKELKKKSSDGIGVMRFRIGTVGQALNDYSTGYSKSHDFMTGFSNTTVGTILSNLYFYDAGSNTFVKNNLATPAQSQSVRLKSISSQIEIKNNSQSEVWVSVFTCKPKNATSSTAHDIFNNNVVADNMDATYDVNNRYIYLSDCVVLKRYWACKLAQKRIKLNAGDTINVYYKDNVSKEIDPSVLDIQTSTYDPKYGSFGYFIFHEGGLSHDITTSTLIGTGLKYTLDFRVVTKALVEYDAGAECEYFVISANEAAAFTAGDTEFGALSNPQIVQGTV